MMTSHKEHADGMGDPREQCCWQGQTFLDALKAMLTRMLFLLHALLVAWRASFVTQEPRTWILAVIYVCMMIENLYVLFVRKGKEWKWFSPCVFLYLMSVIPGIWILELHNASLAQSLNITGPVFAVGSFALDVSSAQWAWVLQQLLVVIIIIGRWLLPKGDLSREQLSSLLLNYVGIASDIIDFFNILSEDEELKNTNFFYVTLTLWSWSMMQFTFVRTAVASNSTDQHLEEDYDEIYDQLRDGKMAKHTAVKGSSKKERSGCCQCSLQRAIKNLMETEAWAIIIGLVTQDGPFFLTRLVAIFHYNIFSNSNFFFTVKNALVLVLQIYRLVVLYHENEAQKKTIRENHSKLILKNLYRNAFIIAQLGKSQAKDFDGYEKGVTYCSHK